MRSDPPCGSELVRYCGDVFTVSISEVPLSWTGARAHLRCDWSPPGLAPSSTNSWHDLPMQQQGDRYRISLPLLDPGLVSLKPYLTTVDGRRHWLDGHNISLKVQPASWRSGNGIYSVYLRQFGPPAADMSRQQRALERAGYTVLPPSGGFADLEDELPRIVDGLGFRILLLLPIFPVPTNYARMGRYGSPYAALDYLSVNPEHARFNRSATPNQQFRHLLDAVHRQQARLMLDLPANHTGWGSFLHNIFPHYFERDANGDFRSPGAWGVVWADLVQLDYHRQQLQHYMVDVFRHWVEQGVDGFRLDAGYMLPLSFWQRVISTVRRSHPDTLFLLEGLGGKLATTRAILQQAGVNWAYSELFQTYSVDELKTYLGYMDKESLAHGELFHFAETHDNPRLAATSPAYARFRCTLNALLSYNGCFGISNGVEDYNTRKIDVHLRQPLVEERTGESMAPLLSRLNALLDQHPAFTSLQPMEQLEVGNAQILAVLRGEQERVLLLFNPGDQPQRVCWPPSILPGTVYDLIEDRPCPLQVKDGKKQLTIPPLGALCLGQKRAPLPPQYQQQLWRALLLRILCHHPRHVDSWQKQDYDASLLDRQLQQLQLDPVGFIGRSRVTALPLDPVNQPSTSESHLHFEERTLLIPQGHYLVLTSRTPFRVNIHLQEDGQTRTLHSSHALAGAPEGQHSYITAPHWFGPKQPLERWSFSVRRYLRHRVSETTYHVLSPQCSPPYNVSLELSRKQLSEGFHYGLMSNHRGSYTMVAARFGEKYSKYDGWLAVNSAARFPADRIVLFSGLRLWLRWQDYSYPLDWSHQSLFRGGADNKLWWQFIVQLNRHFHTVVNLTVRMDDDQLLFQFQLDRDPEASTAALPVTEECQLIIRPLLEERNFHHETQQPVFHGQLHHGQRALQVSAQGKDLAFRVAAGSWHPEPVWQQGEALEIDEQRGMFGRCHLFGPGYFTANISRRASIFFEVAPPQLLTSRHAALSRPPAALPVETVLRQSLRRFLVRREEHWTVLAGYPWFLDWGRDTFIVLRGLIAAGEYQTARDIIICFAGFEHRGTLPNIIFGEQVGNDHTSDAPLWMVYLVGQLLPHQPDLLQHDCRGRTLKEVLRSIVDHTISGCPNGVGVHAESGLVFSPVHYTWMDTNHPSGTPRQGYPVEIQALWWAALRFAHQHLRPCEPLLSRLKQSFQRSYWLEEEGYFSDCLHTAQNQGPLCAQPDDALRPNQLLALTLGLAERRHAQRALHACQQLLVPGAIRSLANRPVKRPLEIRHHGQLLNDPGSPYWPHYSGDEDRQRKPAYHNGTAWGWLFPSYCEAWLQLGGDPDSARSLLLGSLLLETQAIPGFLPEIRDGASPHLWRGCPAQAWSVSETLRLLLLINHRQEGQRK